MNKKGIEDYNEKYGEVSVNRIDRFIDLMKKLKVKDKEIKPLRQKALSLIYSKWSEFSFVIYYTPEATPRPRSGKFGFYVKGAADNYKIFGEFMNDLRKTKKVDVITTPTKLRIDSYFPIPVGMNRLEKVLAELKLIRPISKPDWDNVGKTYSDMIQKNLLLEDATIITGISNKYYSSKPRVEITLEYMNEYDCNFHKKKVESWKSYKESDAVDKDSVI